MAVRAGLIVFGVWNLALAVFMVAAPHAFFTDIGPFGVRNDHYLRDVATFYAAFGVLLLAAVRRPSWQAPALFCVALQFGLHALNHLADIGAAHPYWVGPADFAELAVATVVLVWLFREALRKEVAP
jgi:hypothetical protein